MSRSCRFGKYELLVFSDTKFWRREYPQATVKIESATISKLENTVVQKCQADLGRRRWDDEVLQAKKVWPLSDLLDLLLNLAVCCHHSPLLNLLDCRASFSWIGCFEDLIQVLQTDTFGLNEEKVDDYQLEKIPEDEKY